MKKEGKKFLDIFIRYFLSFIIAFPNFYIFYLVFTPLTLYSTFFLLKFFYNVNLVSNTILLGSMNIEIIDACVAGSAYYLLFILNVITPNIKIEKRFYMILASFVSFLVFNILRIVFLSALFFNSSSFFDITHKFLWYGMSTLLILLIWFGEVYFFKIKDVPAYSDIKFLIKKIR